MKNIFFPEKKLSLIKNTKNEECRALLKRVIETAEKALEIIPPDEESVQVDGEGFAIQHEPYNFLAPT